MVRMAAIGKDDGERKQVTVLFADVSGSMDLAEGQDPEEWRKIMQRFFAILADAVERFEGTVDKFTGDGIMAVFGAPIAHEDHARRACYAALQMLDDVAEYAAELRRGPGLNFSTRIGINSGEVVAGAIGAGGEGEYTAIGHTVGLAQRMEALAEPGKAYLTESTAALATGFLELEDLGEFEIKGASRPVRVFELAGVGAARSRLDLSRERGFSRFVGRDAEMAVLEEALARREAGEGAVVGIVAEPGVGKSRLCHEFAERMPRAAASRSSRPRPSRTAQSIPFMPVLQMLRAYFGIADARPRADRAREDRRPGAAARPRASPTSLPLLFDFLGVPDPDRPLAQMSAEARAAGAGRVVCRLVDAPARRHTVVARRRGPALDGRGQQHDAGRADHLGRRAPTPSRSSTSAPSTRSPGPLADLPRPLARAARPGGHRGAAARPRRRGPLARRARGADPRAHRRATRSSSRRSSASWSRPGTSRASAAPIGWCGRSRRRACPPPCRQSSPLGSTGSARRPSSCSRSPPCVGKEVGARALGLTAGLRSEELDPALCELIEGGFLYEAELYPERVLAFRHPLTREVAYGTQLGERRAATHAAAARALIELEPERHRRAGGAGRPPPGGGRRDAGSGALVGSRRPLGRHSRPQDALRLWRTVTELADGLEESEETTALAVSSRLLQLEYAWRLGMDREEADALAAEANAIAERTGDLHSLALLKLLDNGARPGCAGGPEWLAAVDRGDRSSPTNRATCTCASRSAAAAPTPLCAPATSTGFERAADELLELTRRRSQPRRRLVDRQPDRLGLMAQGAWPA